MPRRIIIPFSFDSGVPNSMRGMLWKILLEVDTRKAENEGVYERMREYALLRSSHIRQVWPPTRFYFVCFLVKRNLPTQLLVNDQSTSGLGIKWRSKVCSVEHTALLGNFDLSGGALPLPINIFCAGMYLYLALAGLNLLAQISVRICSSPIDETKSL